jgi:hypothetical protein
MEASRSSPGSDPIEPPDRQGVLALLGLALTSPLALVRARACGEKNEARDLAVIAALGIVGAAWYALEANVHALLVSVALGWMAWTGWRRGD